MLIGAVGGFRGWLRIDREKLKKGLVTRDSEGNVLMRSFVAFE